MDLDGIYYVKRMTKGSNYASIGACGHTLGAMIPFMEWHIKNSLMPNNILLPPPSLGRMFYCGTIGSIGLMSLYAIFNPH